MAVIAQTILPVSIDIYAVEGISKCYRRKDWTKIKISLPGKGGDGSV
jgi:hypothetical protein